LTRIRQIDSLGKYPRSISFMKAAFVGSLAACVAVFSLSLPLTSCGPNLDVKKATTYHQEASKLKEKFNSLQQQYAAVDAEIATLAKALPPGPPPEESARQLQGRASGEIAVLNEQLKMAAAALREDEAAVAKLKQEAASATPKN
jgi:hypothetical protein